MKKNIELADRNITLTDCTVIYDGERVPAIHYHESTDAFSDGDCVLLNARLEDYSFETIDDVASECWESDGDILDTVLF